MRVCDLRARGGRGEAQSRTNNFESVDSKNSTSEDDQPLISEMLTGMCMVVLKTRICAFTPKILCVVFLTNVGYDDELSKDILR